MNLLTKNNNQTFLGELKCHRCSECNGQACENMLPGLGGVMDGANFKANYNDWKQLYKEFIQQVSNIKIEPKMIRCGPVTGAIENIGYTNEKDFYLPYLQNTMNAGFGLCVGDGTPDEKLHFGIEAIRTLQTKAAFFLKPYPQDLLYKRIELVKPYASYIGVDIDSYNILTMRNLVHLEKKKAEQLQDLRKKADLPFVIKGVFTQDDIQLVQDLKPEVVYISNHGGRVETRKGSTAQFLKENIEELKKHCKQVWVDGGIRTLQDIQTAKFLGADQAILARPFIKATFDNNFETLSKKLLRGDKK